MSARDKFIVLVLLAMVAAATVAGLVIESSSRSAPPAFGGTYTEAVVGVPQWLNPLLAVTAVDRDVSALVFTGLTRFDQRGTVVRDLAADFRLEPDSKTWVFTLRPDARWHDGGPVVADDVLYTVGIAQDRTYRGPFAGSFAGVKVEKVDERTVRFILPDVYAPFIEATTIPLLPAHLLNGVGAAELARSPFNVRPVGTGPFKFDSRDEQRVVLKANEEFYRASPERRRPYLDRIVLRLYPERGTALQALARKEVQGLAGVAAADADRARRLRDLALYFLPSDEETVLFLNVAPERPTFRDRAVRQAMGLAINRPRILQLATDGHGALADQPVPAQSWAFVKDVRRLAHAPEEARVLLEGAGWIDHDGDGVRDKGGVALRFNLLTNDDPPRIATADQISRDLAAVGIEATVQILPWSELVETRARERSFDAMVLAVSTGMDPDPYVFWHSSQTKEPGLNFTGYATLGSDRALEQARRTLDEAKRRELYAQVFAQLAEDAPAIYLYFTDYVYALDRQVRGIRIAPVADPSHRFWNVEEWYVRTKVPE